MAKGIFRSGKQTRPRTTVKGKRYLCARCRRRSPKPVKTPAPWYCPNCDPSGKTKTGHPEVAPREVEGGVDKGRGPENEKTL